MIELLTKIKDYVDEVIQMNFDQYRFNPLNRTESFKAWGERYLAGYTGDDKIKLSSLKELLTQLDNYNEFLQIDQSNLLLNRCKWITPNTQTIPESGSIPVMAAVQNLVIEGEGVTPTIPNVIPISAGFNLASDLMPGSIGYNITDDIWYYNDGVNIKKLVDFTLVTTSHISGLDSILEGISTALLDITQRLTVLEAVQPLTAQTPILIEEGVIKLDFNNQQFFNEGGVLTLQKEIPAPLTAEAPMIIEAGVIKLDYSNTDFFAEGGVLTLQ